MSDKKKLDSLKNDALNTSEVKGGKSGGVTSFRKANSTRAEVEDSLKDKTPHFKGDIKSMEEMKSRRLSGPNSPD